MSQPAPHRQYVSEPSVLERWAGDYLAQRNSHRDIPPRPRTAAERRALIAR
nr:hypothetical protein [Halomonas socia]